MLRAMTDQPITLESVESFIREGRKSLVFPNELEAQFERDTRHRRAKFLRAATLRTVVVYNLFLLTDWLLLPDTIFFCLASSVFVITPWILFVAWLMRSSLAEAMRERAAASVPTVIVLQIAAIYCLTQSSYAPYSLYIALVTMIYAHVIQRLRYFHAVAVSVFMFVVFSLAIVGVKAMPAAVVATLFLTLGACAYMTLIVNFTLDRDVRRSYLHALRDLLKLAEADAEAKRDALTDLANRHYLNARAAEIWRAGDERSSPVAIVLLDVDHFKSFNDLYGHPAGDACLKRIAACVTAELRNIDDLAVRYGGEEFLLLLPATDIADAVRIAERARRAIAALGIPHDGAEKTGLVTASLGVAAAPVSALSSAELIAAADIALYTAKRNGRNQVCPPLLREGKSFVPDLTVLADARARRSSGGDQS
jgi:diguanylate cyclase (GGDEF)-like protein